MSEPLYIVGPTSSGKSALAIQLALERQGEIINADAYQVYNGLPILTAQPTADELTRVPHHLYGFLSAAEEFDAAKYAILAKEKISEVQSRGRLPIIVGGSGLYVKALTHGLSNLPPVDAALRESLAAQGLDELLFRLLALDPLANEHINISNARHVQRALEICLLTGKPASEYKRAWREMEVTAQGYFVNPPREMLYEKINQRTLQMFAEGVRAEVETLVINTPLSTTAAKTIGLQNIMAKPDSAALIADIQQATRRYAKRQITWFKRETYFLPWAG